LFTGLTESVGRLVSLAPAGRVGRIGCASLAAELHLGESIAIDGVCLTIVRTGADWFEVEITPETLRRTAWEGKAPGTAVNLERALRAGDRLGGHLVQGHVDGVATVSDLRPEGEGRRIRVAPPPVLTKYIVEKGSIALDGVSLTVAAVSGQEFEVALIPHTLRATTLGEWGVSRRINVEVDLLAKYVESLLRPYAGPSAQEGSR
jgi:riboflavin synthase